MEQVQNWFEFTVKPDGLPALELTRLAIPLASAAADALWPAYSSPVRVAPVNTMAVLNTRAKSMPATHSRRKSGTTSANSRSTDPFLARSMRTGTLPDISLTADVHPLNRGNDLAPLEFPPKSRPQSS